jgi:hypothetical protein
MHQIQRSEGRNGRQAENLSKPMRNTLFPYMLRSLRFT